MGQYHAVVNLDQKAGYNAWAFGCGVKASEQGESYLPCAALLLLLSNPDAWMGQRVAIVGDYAEDTDLENSPYPASELWNRVEEGDGITVISQKVRKAIETDGLAKFAMQTYTVKGLDGSVQKSHSHQGTVNAVTPDGLGPSVVVYNHDKHETITPTLLGDGPTLPEVIDQGWMGGTGTALTILLVASCKGGARGGGDYDGTHPLVGSWAGDRISVVSTVEGDARDLTATLRDEVMADAMRGWVTYEHEEKGRISRTEDAHTPLKGIGQ